MVHEFTIPFDAMVPNRKANPNVPTFLSQIPFSRSPFTWDLIAVSASIFVDELN